MASAASDPFDFQRFVTAQQGIYAQVKAELAAGAKTSHWMWFIFPQLASLGRSATARHFGIASLAEAQVYRHHPVLGARLQECCALLLPLRGLTAAADLRFGRCAQVALVPHAV